MQLRDKVETNEGQGNHRISSDPACDPAGLGPGRRPAARAETPADTLFLAAAIDDIISLDPAQSFEFSGNDVNYNAYDLLVDFDPLDMETGFKFSLAESWEISKDGMFIKMREGVIFHSGSPLGPRMPPDRCSARSSWTRLSPLS